MIKNESDQALKLNVGKRKKITIAEGMKLYQVLGAQKFSKISHDTYAGIVSQNLLPERSIDQMKNFWKEYSVKTLEQYLVEAIFYGWDYCLSFKEIPNEDFEAKHRQQFRMEFAQLEASYHSNAYMQHSRQHLSGGMLDASGPGSYGADLQDEDSSDSDIFNEKVTQRLDEMNKQEAKKMATIDKLTSPEFNTTMPTE